MKIKLSQYNPRRTKQIITELRILILINLIRIDPDSNDSYVMKKDTMLKNVLRTQMSLTRRRETREDIMLMLQKMMDPPGKEISKKVMILQVMKNMSWFPLSRETSHIEAMISL